MRPFDIYFIGTSSRIDRASVRAGARSKCLVQTCLRPLTLKQPDHGTDLSRSIGIFRHTAFIYLKGRQPETGHVPGPRTQIGPLTLQRRWVKPQADKRHA